MGDLTPEPVSPCKGTCMLDADDRCTGCGRTLDEIAAWGAMPAEERRAIMASLPQRMAGDPR